MIAQKWEADAAKSKQQSMNVTIENSRSESIFEEDYQIM